MRFKAAILVELNKPLVVDELEVPVLDVGQVLVMVHASGICGAQIGEITGAKGPDPWLPHLLGHEGGGVVEDVGPGVTQVKPGDHVVMHWRKGRGIDAKPPRYKRLNASSASVGGGWVTTFNDHAVVSENRLTVIDKNIPFEIAALMGCAVTTALGIISNEAKLKIGESIAIAGVGGVGLNLVQGAALAGAHPIIAIDRFEKKLRMAHEAGATKMVWVRESRFIFDQVKDKIDVFVDCTGDVDMISAGYDLVRPGTGRLILVGQPPSDHALLIPSFRRHYCGKTVMDSQGGLTDPNVDIPRYLNLYMAGKLKLDQLITHRLPLERVNDAIELIKAGETGRCVLTMP